MLRTTVGLIVLLALGVLVAPLAAEAQQTACIVPRFDLGVIVAYYQSFSRSRVAWEEEMLWPQQCVRGM